jgi:hypothetical protein
MTSEVPKDQSNKWPNKFGLTVDWATFEAAKFACTNWHYSKTMPVGKIVKIGVWEREKFIGVVLFSRGANAHIGSQYGLDNTTVCELTRIALTKHVTPVSKIAAIAIGFLRRSSPGLRLLVSYADPEQGHHGGIYQAGGWLYVGKSQAQASVMHNGKVMHKKSANNMFGTIKGMEKSPMAWKHKYLMALDAAMREQITPLAQPYPKRITRAKDQDAGHPPALDGETPIRALQQNAA